MPESHPGYANPTAVVHLVLLMLSQIVRPMVRTQLRLLANCQATRATLISTIAQWLGFLGVRAQVDQLSTHDNRICVCLTVEKPEACDPEDWQQIIHNLEPQETAPPPPTPQTIPLQQQVRIQRLLAYLIQVGNPDLPVQWDQIYPHLQALGLDESLLVGIRSSLKVPQSLDLLLEGLDPDVAAIALPKAMGIAMIDRQVNSYENHALTALLQAMKQTTAG